MVLTENSGSFVRPVDLVEVVFVLTAEGATAGSLGNRRRRIRTVAGQSALTIVAVTALARALPRFARSGDRARMTVRGHLESREWLLTPTVGRSGTQR